MIITIIPTLIIRTSLIIYQKQQLGREYSIPERHDPLYLMFDNDFHLGLIFNYNNNNNNNDNNFEITNRYRYSLARIPFVQFGNRRRREDAGYYYYIIIIIKF